jgi:hypothetical protein
MKRLISTMACAAVAVALCFGSSAKASIPVAMAPAASQSSALIPISGRVIIVQYVFVNYAVVGDLPYEGEALEHVDQAAAFDRTT